MNSLANIVYILIYRMQISTQGDKLAVATSTRIRVHHFWANITYILIYNTQKSNYNDRHATSWLLARRSEWSDLNFDIRNGLLSQKNLYFDI